LQLRTINDGEYSVNRIFRFELIFAACALAPIIASTSARAQVSFATAVDRAVGNSPQVRSAEADLAKAQSAISVLKDIYIPSVVVGGGLGTAYGITLGVPTIFTVSAQSLVYSPQQRSYIRSARLSIEAAQYALADARNQAAQDAANTYCALNHDQAAVKALEQQFGYALKMVSIVQDRVNAQLDTASDLKKARRDALQTRLQWMQMQDDLAAQRRQLSQVTGLPQAELIADGGSIPDLPPVAEDDSSSLPADPGMLAAEANQKATSLRAKGDAQYTWKPTIGFGAQYGRVSPIENVSEFYNLHGNYNSASIGVDIKFPVLDRVRAAVARQSAADAARQELDLEAQKQKQAEGRRKLTRDAEELNVKAQLAELDYGIASDELQSVLVAEHGSTAGNPVTPKEEMGARIQERQQYLGMLDAKLASEQAEIGWLRQAGQLRNWLHSLGPAAVGTK
jgi:outer membrane protein TolC